MDHAGHPVHSKPEKGADMGIRDAEGFIYELVDHGAEHAQFFQGAGVAYTQYTDIATGCGSSAREAGHDALEQFWQQIDKRKITVAEAERLEAAVNDLNEAEDAHDKCVVALRDEQVLNAIEDSHEECEWHHYVSIRWAVRR